MSLTTVAQWAGCMRMSLSLSRFFSLSLSRSLSPTVTCVLGVLGAQTNVRLQSLYNVTAKWKVGGASEEKKKFAILSARKSFA